MPSAARRRRTQQQDDSSEEERPQTTQRNRRRPVDSEDEEEEEEEEEEAGDDSMDVDTRPEQDQTVKKLVRYALACEYQRIPIRRTGISEKVIQKQRGSFKRVFDAAQAQLRTKFGMEMVELPTREKTTMKDKRAALKSKGGSKSSSYILTTILPSEYRIPEIMPPSIIGTVEDEATYLGICTVIVTIISLSANGTMSDAKLKQHLSKMNLERNAAGLGKTEELLKKMGTQGYIHKVVEKTADEETIDWRVGPRGKVEIAGKGIRDLVLEVYGENAPEDLDARLQKSLGMELKKVNKKPRIEPEQEQGEDEEEPEDGDPGPSNRRGSSRRR